MALLTTENYAIYFQRVSLLYKRPEVRASLETILSVFTVAVLIFAAIRPTLTNIVSLQKKITDQEMINTKADNKMAQLLKAQDQLKTNSGSLYLFDAAVPDIFSYVDSTKRIEYLARLNNVTVDSLSMTGITLLDGGKLTAAWATKIAKPTGTNSILDPINFSIEGSPQNVVAFLRQIENIDRLVKLSNVALSKQVGTNKTEDTLKATGQLTFYFYSQKP